MIFAYIAAIVAFLGICLAFVLSAKNQEKKRLERLCNDEIIKTSVETPKDVGIEPVCEKKEEKMPINEIQVQFEDFVLDKEEKIEKKIAFDDEEDELDRKFAEYQKFLRENLESDEMPRLAEEMRPQREYEDIEFEDMMDKNPDEISEMIKNLPPNMREIFMSNVLARKEFDDLPIEE